MLRLLELLLVVPLAAALEFWPTTESTPPSFINTDVVRTVELGPSVYTATSYSIKSLADVNNDVYYVTMSPEEEEQTSWIEAKVKGVQGSLEVKRLGQHLHTLAFLYSIKLAKPLPTGEALTLLVNTVQTHASYPKPAVAKQADLHFRVYEADAVLSTPYETTSQRLRIKAPTPNIRSFSTPAALTDLAVDSPAKQTGASVTYGPFKPQPPTAVRDFNYAANRVAVHFEMNIPMLTVVRLDRAAEVSHWGANLNVQDEFMLRNDGPKLKGQFSRYDYQQEQYNRRSSSLIIPGINLHLPPGAHSVYYYDQIGNVSTSTFRPGRSSSGSRIQPMYSTLEMRPRYPLVGGWNYTFTIGWDAPLGDSLHWDAANGRWILAVPFMTPFPGTPVDEAHVKVILPEGSTDITVHPPFQVDLMERTTHITYLDSIGRPAYTFHATNLTEKHDGLIYVTYKLPFRAQLQKPFAVATAALILFSATWALKRIDMSIQK